eukprot:4276670-Amphidinium_carterae.2
MLSCGAHNFPVSHGCSVTRWTSQGAPVGSFGRPVYLVDCVSARFALRKFNRSYRGISGGEGLIHCAISQKTEFRWYFIFRKSLQHLELERYLGTAQSDLVMSFVSYT